MAANNASAERTELRAQILRALGDGEVLNSTQLYGRCPAAPDRTELARLLYELRRAGQITTVEGMHRRVMAPDSPQESALGVSVSTVAVPAQAETAVDPVDTEIADLRARLAPRLIMGRERKQQVLVDLADSLGGALAELLRAIARDLDP